MKDLLLALLDQPAMPHHLSTPIMWLSGLVELLALTLTVILLLKAIRRSLPASVRGLPAKILSWPKNLKLSWRPAGVPGGLSAMGHGSASVACFISYLAVGSVMIFHAPAPSRSVEIYLMAIAFMLASITCSRGFMIAGVKAWHGAR